MPPSTPSPAPSSTPPPRPPSTTRATAAAVLATSGLEALPRDHAARLPPLLAAMNDLGTGPELDSTLDRIVQTAARIADCRYAAIGVLASDRAGLEHFVTHGMTPEQRDRIARDPDGRHGLLGAVVERDEPLRLNDLNADPRAGGLPYGHPPMHSFLGVPLKVGEETVGTFYLTEKHGGGGFTDNDVLLIRLLATEAGIAIHNARLHEAARQRERWIEGSAAITTSLLSGGVHETAGLLAVVAEQARRLADAAAGIVLLPAAERGLEIVEASADDARGLIGTVVSSDAAVLGRLLAGEPVFVDDSAHDPRTVTLFAGRFGPSMLLPLENGGQLIGTLALPRAQGAEPFTETEKTLATQFAAQAALALVLADAQRDREQLAVYEDRDRIARDLHDVVIQRLFATGMTLQGARREAAPGGAGDAAPGGADNQAPDGAGDQAPDEHEAAPGGRTGVASRIGLAIDQLDATIAEIRTAIFALQQDPGEAHAGLRTRVLREIGLAAGPLGFRPSVRFVGPVDARVGEPTTRDLVAALREALSNASRHAQATRVEVTVDATVTLLDGSAGVRLTVADDGVGMAPEGRRSGLTNLARRAENLGGTAYWATGAPSEAEPGAEPGAGLEAAPEAVPEAAPNAGPEGALARDVSGTTLTWQGRL